MELGGILAYFKHGVDENHPNKGTTDCTIARKDKRGNITKLSDGHSSVHYTDTYNKAKGRAITLTRALKNSPLTKIERRNVWRDYFSIIRTDVEIA